MRRYDRDNSGWGRSFLWQAADDHEVRVLVAHQVADIRTHADFALAVGNALAYQAAVGDILDLAFDLLRDAHLFHRFACRHANASLFRVDRDHRFRVDQRALHGIAC